MTYVRMREEFAYLVIVLDAFSRRVIGWALETHMLAGLVITALEMAIDARQPQPGTLVHHSDRGVHRKQPRRRCRADRGGSLSMDTARASVSPNASRRFSS
jgi:transposase InsO family protein